MQNVLILGAGNIGRLIACLLVEKNYTVHLTDVKTSTIEQLDLGNMQHQVQTHVLDAKEDARLDHFIKKNNIETLISALPFHTHQHLPLFAKQRHLHYFDLSEDRQTAKLVHTTAQNAKTAFVPQCGLAPGFISIVTHDLMQAFDSVETIAMRVGALPLHPHNTLLYALTWSVDGLINEYGNPCHGLVNGKLSPLQPLEDLETLEIDGTLYEAFNTSGGIGSLAHSMEGKIKDLTYKTLRYPGHCQYMRFLFKDLKMNEDRETLKRIFTRALPTTHQDVVVIYVSIQGHKNGVFTEDNFVRKIYGSKRFETHWSAIQLATASSLCTIVDIIKNNPSHYQGIVKQEDFSLKTFLDNPLAEYYRTPE